MTAAIGVLLVAGLGSALSSAGAASPNTARGGSGADGHALPTPIQHVFLIMMENEQTGIIYDNETYETELANTYGWGGDGNNPDGVGYYAVCHPSAPNYLALTSGLPLQCGSDNFNTYSVNNLGNLLDTAGDSWVAWEESASVPCQEYNSANGLYVVRHNPFPYYSDLGGDTPGSACETHVLPIANLTADYPYSQTPPDFTYIAPNVLDDGHSSSALTGDNWLSTFVPRLIAQPWFSSSVIFITYDEAYLPNGDENFTGYGGLEGGPVYTVAISPYTLGVGALTYNASHYDELSTFEWLLGLPGTGTGNDSTVAFPAMVPLFNDELFSPGLDLRYTDLIGADLSARPLEGDQLQYANLAHTDLAYADLRGADLAYADLAGADLKDADLQGADLAYANLTGADLQGATLQGAQLSYADLAGALLTGLGPFLGEETDFNHADLFGAQLLGAICGSPNDLSAVGADVLAENVPAACTPPL